MNKVLVVVGSRWEVLESAIMTHHSHLHSGHESNKASR